MKKLLLFGAGKIGRSFIAQIFSIEGYEIIFVDISKKIVDLLNKHAKYPVYIKDTKEEILWVENVKALLSSQIQEITKEISETSLIAISVGKAGLKDICPLIAKGIQKKYESNPNLKTDIIVAENMRGADLFLLDEIKKSLPASFPLNALIGVQETSIGKMVPIITEERESENPLAVYAEAYNTLIVSSEFLNGIPDVKALSPKSNIKAWVDRKLFIHNLGHCVAAYVGNYFHPERKYIYEVLEDSKVEKIVEDTMLQAALILQRMYPGEFSDKHLNDHIKDLISRFKNVALADTVYRVGCDLARKLSYDDRLVSPIRNAILFNSDYSKILFAYFCSLHFSAKSETNDNIHSDIKILNDYKDNSIEFILRNYSKINSSELLKMKLNLDELNENVK